MKIKITFISICIATSLMSCLSARYLPESNEIDVNQHGSFIRVNTKDDQLYQGELLAVDGINLVILNRDTTKEKISEVNTANVKKFKLRYAKSKHYEWTIPVSMLVTIAHGWYAGLTLPVNIITTSTVSSGGEYAFEYNQKIMTFDKLKMFARFPQGIPSNVDLARIKSN